MGLYPSPLENNSPPVTYNGPNVSQYGWTEQETGYYVQLLEYVEKCADILDECEDIRDSMQGQSDQVEDIYNEILLIKQDMDEQMEEFNEDLADFELKYTDFIAKYNQIITLYTEIVTMHEEVLNAADQAAASASTALDAAADAEGYAQTALGYAQAADFDAAFASDEADRAQGYAEMLEHPYEDMGTHTIIQGYPAVPSFSSMWNITDGGPDPEDPEVVWNPGDHLIYSTRTGLWSRLSGQALDGGETVPIEILDDLIMQQGKKVRFRVDDFIDHEGMSLDVDGDLVVGEIPTTDNTNTPLVKIGLAATELYHIIGMGSGSVTTKYRIYDQGFKPTAADVGAYTKNESDGKYIGSLVDVRPTNNDANLVDPGYHFYEMTGTRYNTPTGSSSGNLLSLARDYSEGMTYGHQLYLDGDNMWQRGASGGTFNEWKAIYHEGHKPTAVDVGAAPAILSNGIKVTSEDIDGTLTNVISIGTQTGAPNGGIITIGSGECVDDLLANYNHNSEALVLGADSDIFFHTNIQNGWDARKTIKIATDGNIYTIDGTKKVYHQGFKPTASEVGALPSGSYNPRSDSLNNTEKTVPVYSGDLDDLVGGDFVVADMRECTNTPDTPSIYLYIETRTTFSGTALLQTAWPYAAADGDDEGGVWTRVKANNGVWKSWVRLYDTKNPPTATDVGAASAVHTHAGDSLTPIDIGAGKDLNTYQTPGVYYQNTDADAVSGSNYPEDKSGALHVYTAAGVVQLYHVYGSNNKSYRRTFFNGTWSAWAKLYDAANKPTAAEVGAVSKTGDTMTGTLSAPDFYVTSDRRLKSDFAPIKNALDKVCSLDGQTYLKNNKREAGIIAQDLREVLPEAVHEDTDGYLSVTTAGTIALLVEAIKELRAEVEELKNGRT